MGLADATEDLDAFTQTLAEELTVGISDETGTLFNPSLVPPLPQRFPIVVGGARPEIVLKERISRGGMGEVMLASQLSLKRDVAVKRAAHDDVSAAERELVVEAKVAGALEHPNIVPVHLLGSTHDGHPVLVMKRIEGRTWSQLLADGRDLKRDVDILVDVCRALHFAHTRGVLHRDVKPANVMVGSFGEVYLFDWGIAAASSSSRATIAGLAAGRTEGSIVGTPGYMAPEMTMAGAPLDERTDVYLAGAVLHELLTGVPPHRRANITESLHAAHVAAEPAFADSVPEELAEICRRAMRRTPEERFQSADEMRLALTRYRERAPARALLADAERQLDEIVALPRDADPAVIQRAFQRCRFGFEQARRLWPESSRAREGAQRAVLHVVERELDAKRLDSAELLLADLHVRPLALVERLEVLRRERSVEKSTLVELERAMHEQDRTVAVRERNGILLASSLGWLSVALVLQVLTWTRIYVANAAAVAVFMGVSGVLMALGGVLMPRLRATKASLSSYVGLVIGVFALAITYFLAWRSSMPVAHALAFGHTIFATSHAIAATYERSVRANTTLGFLVVPALLLLPQAAWFLSGLGSFVTLGMSVLSLPAAQNPVRGARGRP